MAGLPPPDGTASADLARRMDELYAVRPPWDIGRPQPAFLDLARSGALRGRVLDVGCGTGEHALMCADLGLDVTGVDLAGTALRTAEDKARRKGAAVRFLRHDALRITGLGERFDTVLDSGLFHLLDPADRPAYTAQLHAVLRPGGRYFLLCFSDREPESGRKGPYRLSRADLTTAFAGTLRIDAVEPVTIDITLDDTGIRAWRASMTRK